jgi:hypothetical protein
VSPEFIEQFHFNESTRVSCPSCSLDRKKTNSKDMTLTRRPDGAVVYHCHHCLETGSVQKKREFKLAAVPQKEIISSKLEAKHYSYLLSRGITKETADKIGLFAADKFFARLNKVTDAIGFPYFRDGALVAAKYRSFPEKDFTQDAGGAHDFFGLHLVEKGKPLIIVEGEIDVRWDLINTMKIGKTISKEAYDGMIADISAYTDLTDAMKENLKTLTELQKQKEDI